MMEKGDDWNSTHGLTGAERERLVGAPAGAEGGTSTRSSRAERGGPPLKVGLAGRPTVTGAKSARRPCAVKLGGTTE